MRVIQEDGLTVVEDLDLPADPTQEAVYRLTPTSRGEGFFTERTDRNIGWITTEEQTILRRSVVAVGGCGGMGGVGAELLLRAGVGEVRIADPEVFENSNIHRQIAAGVSTIGASKAFATAQRMRSISDDTTIVVYPQGVSQETVSHFVRGADLVLDEVEAWAVGPRLLIHREALNQGVHVINCNSIGAGTRLFLFTPESVTLEQCLGLTCEQALRFHARFTTGIATPEEKKIVVEAIVRGLLPELPEYSPRNPTMSNVDNLRHRLLEEGKAMILASNPYGAASFMVNHTIFYLLRNSSVVRQIVRPVPMPGYLYRDDLLGISKVFRGRWY